MLEPDDMEILEEMNNLKNKKSFKDVVNKKNITDRELDEFFIDDAQGHEENSSH